MKREDYIALHNEWTTKLEALRSLQKECDQLGDKVLAASLEPDTPIIHFGKH